MLEHARRAQAGVHIGGGAGAARDRACEGSDSSTPPDIPADGSYADPNPHRARLDFEAGAGAGAPRGPAIVAVAHATYVVERY